MYVYIMSEPGLWTVGFYAPDGTWNTDSDWNARDDARARVHHLNGGGAETRELTWEEAHAAVKNSGVHGLTDRQEQDIAFIAKARYKAEV